MRITAFLSCVAAVALLVVAGCGSQPDTVVHPNYHRPVKPLTTTPLVECVGNELCIGLVAYANGPNGSMWRCDDCAQGANSGQTLANLPLALAKKPDVVLIITGSYDVDDPDWTGVCNDTPSTPATATCNNVISIGTQLNAANIPFIYTDVPNWYGGTLSSQLAPDYDIYGVDLVNERIDYLDHVFSDTSYIQESLPGPSQYVELGAVLGPDEIGPTGIDPNDQGYAAMLALVQPKINALHVGGTK